MEPLLDRVIFSVAGEDYRWSDAVLAAAVSGIWPAVERDARRGLAAELAHTAAGQELGADEMRDAADRFRYERGLISADETLEWLRRFELDGSAWTAYVRRTVLRERSGERLDEFEMRHVPEDGAVRDVVLVEAICSGALAAAAKWLAGVAAVAPEAGEHRPAATLPLPELPRVPGLDPATCGPRIAHIAELDASARSFLSAAESGTLVEREFELRRLDWVSVTVERAVLVSEGAAREVVLLVREDGIPLGEAAAAAGSRPATERLFLEDLEPDLRDRLIGASLGEIVGPVSAEGGWVVARVLERRESDAADPDLRARAIDAIRTRLVEREKNAKVRWHERL